MHNFENRSSTLERVKGIEEKALAQEFAEIFSAEDLGPTKRNYLARAEKALGNLTEANRGSKLLLNDVTSPINSAIKLCEDINRKNETSHVIGYALIARIGELQKGLEEFAAKIIHGKEGFGSIDELRAEFGAQKAIAEEIAASLAADGAAEAVPA